MEFRHLKGLPRVAMHIVRLQEERGATATEYSVVVGFIAMIILAGVGLFGLALDGYFNQLSVAVRAALGLP